MSEVSLCLPNRLKAVLRPIPPQIEEIRLRLGAPLCVRTSGGKERFFSAVIDERDLAVTLENAAQGSRHTILDAMKQGYLPLPGGHRLGVCGKTAGGAGLQAVTSLCIRAANRKPGIAKDLLPKLFSKDSTLQNTLILAPPGAGKTTLLRELVRVLSDGEGCKPHHVAVADERSEIGLTDVGARTDVWQGLPKAEAAVMLLRGMSPDVLAMDELTAPADAEAALLCAGCGVALLATVHAKKLSDLRKRAVYRPLEEIFTVFVTVDVQNGKRHYTIDN